MSYTCVLIDPVTKEELTTDVPHQIRGGTYQMGGSERLWLNVTYNYSDHFIRVLHKESLSGLEGMTGAESIPLLKKAISELKDDASDNYWESTEGNAKQALCGLLALAQMRPDGVWRVT